MKLKKRSLLINYQNKKMFLRVLINEEGSWVPEMLSPELEHHLPKAPKVVVEEIITNYT